MNDLQNIQKLAKMLDGKQLLSHEDLSSILTDIVKAFTEHRSATSEINKNTRESLETTLKNIQSEHQLMMDNVKSETSLTKEEMQKMMDKCTSDMKKMCDDMAEMIPEDGKDGVDADEEKIIKEVLSKIEIPEAKEETPNEEVDKINQATNQIKKERIEGLEQAILNSASNAVSSLPQTTMLVNGKRSKNLSFSGLTVNTVGDTTTVTASAGAGDVVGPASAVDSNVVMFDGTTGKLIKDSGLTLAGSNTGDVTLAGTPDYITIVGQVITRSLINLTTHITGILTSVNGGTGNGFTKFTGPTTSEKTFTLPDASSTIVVQGGALGTPSSGTLTNATGLPVNGIVDDTTSALGIGTLELGHASDTTVSRVSAGKIAVEGVNVVTTSSTDSLTNKSIGAGVLQLEENASIALDPAGSADGKYSGITISGTAGATLSFGDVVVLDVTASKWLLADANSAAAADGDARGLIGMCVLAANDTQTTTILLNGTCRADANFPALTITAPVYLSEVAGDIVVAQPTTTDAVIRVLGFALTADEIYFNPSSDYVTHV